MIPEVWPLSVKYCKYLHKNTVWFGFAFDPYSPHDSSCEEIKLITSWTNTLRYGSVPGFSVRESQPHMVFAAVRVCEATAGSHYRWLRPAEAQTQLVSVILKPEQSEKERKSNHDAATVGMMTPDVFIRTGCTRA